MLLGTGTCDVCRVQCSRDRAQGPCMPHGEKTSTLKFANLIFWSPAREKKVGCKSVIWNFRSVKLTAEILTLMVPAWLGTSSGQPTRIGEFVFQAISESGIGRKIEDSLAIEQIQNALKHESEKVRKVIFKKVRTVGIISLFMSLPCCCTKMARVCLDWQSLAT